MNFGCVCYSGSGDEYPLVEVIGVDNGTGIGSIIGLLDGI